MTGLEAEENLRYAVSSRALYACWTATTPTSSKLPACLESYFKWAPPPLPGIDSIDKQAAESMGVR